MSISGKMYYWEDRARYIPDGTGVYALYDEKKVLIYLGTSKNLREQFITYLKTNFSNNKCKSKTRYYKREFASDHENRLRMLLDEYQKEHGCLPKCNLNHTPFEKQVDIESGFYFYEDIGKPIHEAAFSLREFKEKISQVPDASLEFHQKRGDFANWIRNILNDIPLAEAMDPISGVGDDLRRTLIRSFSVSNKSKCPKCGIETDPIKTWKMAGRPSEKGERLQLTIGHFKCSECNRTFRRVLAKKRIKSS
jgi:hypothetical protein